MLVSKNCLQVDPPADYGQSPYCNDYLPEDSVFTRFLYVVGYFARQGFYVLIDNHANTDPTVVNDPNVSSWHPFSKAQAIFLTIKTAKRIPYLILGMPVCNCLFQALASQQTLLVG